MTPNLECVIITRQFITQIRTHIKRLAPTQVLTCIRYAAPWVPFAYSYSLTRVGGESQESICSTVHRTSVRRRSRSLRTPKAQSSDRYMWRTGIHMRWGQYVAPS